MTKEEQIKLGDEIASIKLQLYKSSINASFGTDLNLLKTINKVQESLFKMEMDLKYKL